MNPDRTLHIQTLLLTRVALRREFRLDPRSALFHEGVTEEEFRELPAWNPDELEAQAHTLVEKRWHEVQQLLFSTLSDGGARYRECFGEYAPTNWPEGHQRHLIDAVRFADHLSRNGNQRDLGWRVNLLRFRLERSRFRVHWVRSLPVCSRWSCGVQVLYRRSNEPRQILLYLAV